MLEMYWNTIFFILGVVLGSFFNVVGLRLPKNISFHTGRSYCPSCNKQLYWYELIPIISYLLQCGKCNGCKMKISPLYPVMELTTGILFMFSFKTFGFQIELIVALFLISMLIIFVVTDITYMLIPNKILLFFLPIFIVLRLLVPLDPWYDSIIGAVAGYVLIAIIIIVSRGGMGAGDMKLFGVLGIVLGLSNVLLTFFLAAILGTLIGGAYMLFTKVDRKQPIPFGPHIAVASIVTYFYGKNIIQFYLTLL